MLLKNLIQKYDFKVTDDYGNDWSEQAKKDVEAIFK